MSDRPELLEQLIAGAVSAVWRHPQRGWSSEPINQIKGLLPGAFNPLHEGHRQLITVGESLLNGSVAAELSIVNVEKPEIDIDEIIQRVAQFADVPLVLTRVATFVEKSRLFPGVTFVVGVDTAERIIDRAFYDHDQTRCDDALGTIAGRGCRFLVAARLQGTQLLRFRDLDDADSYRHLFDEIPVEQFRHDISSTELRRRP